MRAAENPLFWTALRDRELRGAARDVLIVLGDLLVPDAFIPVKHSGIEAATGIADATVADCLAKLIARGYLERGARSGKLWTYRFSRNSALLPVAPEHPRPRTAGARVSSSKRNGARKMATKFTPVPQEVGREEYERLRLRVMCGALPGKISRAGEVLIAPSGLEQLRRENEEEAQREWRRHARVAALMGMADFGPSVTAEIAEQRRAVVITNSETMARAAVGAPPAGRPDDIDSDAQARHLEMLARAEFPERGRVEAEQERSAIARRMGGS